MSPEQQQLIAKTRAAVERCTAMAAEADTLGLGVLAREWDYFGKQLALACDRQEQTLSGTPVADALGFKL